MSSSGNTQKWVCMGCYRVAETIPKTLQSNGIPNQGQVGAVALRGSSFLKRFFPFFQVS